MKILELRDFGDKNKGEMPTLIITTDSSVIRDNRPVFLPEISQRWCCEFSVAYLISRLGKSISEKFASRYYDMMTLCARLIPLDIVECGGVDGHSNWTPWATAFDGAMAMGAWQENGAIKAIDIAAPQSISFANAMPPIDKAIKLLSKNMIIKTGDVVIPPAPLYRCDISIGDHVEARLNGEEVLKFNVK